jgi:ATP-dependent DNA helicase RecQ
MSHLAKLYLDGETVDLYKFVSEEEEVNLIAKAKIKLESPTALKPYYDHLKEKVAYDKIRIAWPLLKKETQLINYCND